MSWKQNWGRPSSVIPSISAAGWRIELPNGKALHGTKRELAEEAAKHGITQIYDRSNKQWVPLKSKPATP